MRRTKKIIRSEREFNSRLPVWIIEPGEKPGTLNVECPRCGGKVIASRKTLMTGEAREFMGRSCMYCFRTNRLPEKYMPKKMLEFLDLAKGKRDE